MEMERNKQDLTKHNKVVFLYLSTVSLFATPGGHGPFSRRGSERRVGDPGAAIERIRPWFRNI
ncbi:MAG TPA: hypothetical protein PK653_03390, partial [Syntrophales bacterium]|nr:hypothetical protein [Syntrophales bacterium]